MGVASETLRLCRTNYINTCIETSAFAPWAHLWQVAQYCHTVFVDLKHMDSEKHREQTGVPNELILENIQKLCQALPQRGGRVIVRLPLIPGCNDGAEDVAAAAGRGEPAQPPGDESSALPQLRREQVRYDRRDLCALRPGEQEGEGPEAAGASRALPAVRPGQSGQPGGRRHRAGIV